MRFLAFLICALLFSTSMAASKGKEIPAALIAIAHCDAGNEGNPTEKLAFDIYVNLDATSPPWQNTAGALVMNGMPMPHQQMLLTNARLFLSTFNEQPIKFRVAVAKTKGDFSLRADLYFSGGGLSGEGEARFGAKGSVPIHCLAFENGYAVSDEKLSGNN